MLGSDFYIDSWSNCYDAEMIMGPNDQVTQVTQLTQPPWSLNHGFYITDDFQCWLRSGLGFLQTCVFLIYMYMCD